MLILFKAWNKWILIFGWASFHNFTGTSWPSSSFISDTVTMCCVSSAPFRLNKLLHWVCTVPSHFCQTLHLCWSDETKALKVFYPSAVTHLHLYTSHDCAQISWFSLTCAVAPPSCFEVLSKMHPHYFAACSSGVGFPLLLCLYTQHLDDTCFPSASPKHPIGPSL